MLITLHENIWRLNKTGASLYYQITHTSLTVPRGTFLNLSIMQNSVKRQTAKVGVAGSFFNQLMSNNDTLPQVGQGATELHYTDRSVYEVVEVSEDGNTCKIESLQAVANPETANGHGHQNWIFKPTGHYKTLVWRKDAWYQKYVEVVFEPSFVKKCRAEGIDYIGMHLRKNNPELANQIWGTEGRPYPQNVVAGYTKAKTSYQKIKILFGQKDYYYDWSF
jgi:hypothetical protein